MAEENEDVTKKHSRLSHAQVIELARSLEPFVEEVREGYFWKPGVTERAVHEAFAARGFTAANIDSVRKARFVPWSPPEPVAGDRADSLERQVIELTARADSLERRLDAIERERNPPLFAHFPHAAE